MQGSRPRRRPARPDRGRSTGGNTSSTPGPPSRRPATAARTSTGPSTTWRASYTASAAEGLIAMLEELKEEQIVNKVGGRFKLSTLIQKRMIALNQGSRPMVDPRGLDKMTVVIQEIMQDKI